jgi:hypothetical protein
MRRNLISIGILVALAGAWMIWQRGCARTMADIEVSGGAVLVRNQTDEDWQSVRIWVNDYYSGTLSELRAGAFVREPVSRFVAAQGQTLKSTAPIRGVVVLATTPSGKPIRVLWGESAWH